MYEAPSPVHIVYCLEEVQVKELAADGHLHLIEGVLQDKVAIKIIDPAHMTAIGAVSILIVTYPSCKDCNRIPVCLEMH